MSGPDTMSRQGAQRKAVKPQWSRVTALALGWSRGSCGRYGLEGLPEQTLMEAQPWNCYLLTQWGLGPHPATSTAVGHGGVGLGSCGSCPGREATAWVSGTFQGPHWQRSVWVAFCESTGHTEAGSASHSSSAGPALAHSSPTAVGREQQVKAGRLIVPGSL